MEQATELPAGTPELPEAVLWAALKLFADKGYFNTSLTEISQAAGLESNQGVYRHFASKHAIAVKLYENILASLNVSIDEIRRGNQSAAEQLRAIVDLFFRLTDDAPQVMRFLLLLKLDEFLPEQKPLSDTPAFTKIHKIIQHGVRSGEIRSIDPQLANSYFFGVINNTLRMVLTGALEKKADAYLSQTWLMAWNVIAKKSSCF